MLIQLSAYAELFLLSLSVHSTDFLASTPPPPLPLSFSINLLSSSTTGKETKGDRAQFPCDRKLPSSFSQSLRLILSRRVEPAEVLLSQPEPEPKRNILPLFHLVLARRRFNSKESAGRNPFLSSVQCSVWYEQLLRLHVFRLHVCAVTRS